MRLRVWACTDHAGFWPVGTASVVLAESEGATRELLDATLRERGLNPEDPPYTLTEVKGRGAVILRDGDY